MTMVIINPDFGSGALTMIDDHDQDHDGKCDGVVCMRHDGDIIGDGDTNKLVITDKCVNTTETLLLIRRRRMQSPFVNTRLQDATAQALVHLDRRPRSS